MSKKRNLIFLCLLILGVLLISGCFLIPTPSYTVTFDSQGGSAVDSQTVEQDEKATDPTAPTKEGYIFFGWYKEFGCTNAWDFDIDTVTSDITLYAGWTILVYPFFSYTVTYNGNGHTAGTVPVDPASPYESRATVTVLGNTGYLTRINNMGASYRFTGWNTKADGSGTNQVEGSTFTMGASNVTLYAQWTAYVLRDIGPAGGYIFYDKSGYSSGWRYLEAAPSDQGTSAPWGCNGTLISGADGTAVGTGGQNTIDIETGCQTAGTAADICANLSLGGYSDWFLPSKDELNLMYTNLKVAGVGGFADIITPYFCYYWSSSEYNAFEAWLQSFHKGGQYNDPKYAEGRVRAVRAF